MANIKKYRICADLPYDWVEKLSDEDAARVLRHSDATPFDEHRIVYEGGGVRDGTGDGLWRVWFVGEYAARGQNLAMLVRSLASVPEARVHLAELMDIEWDPENPIWESILSSDEAEGIITYEEVGEGPEIPNPPKVTIDISKLAYDEVNVATGEVTHHEPE